MGWEMAVVSVEHGEEEDEAGGQQVRVLGQGMGVWNMQHTQDVVH